ncbi:MAG: signal recognition particle-docking protein FtsY [Candidatus Micrarchaeia archaeon]
MFEGLKKKLAEAVNIFSKKEVEEEEKELLKEERKEEVNEGEQDEKKEQPSPSVEDKKEEAVEKEESKNLIEESKKNIEVDESNKNSEKNEVDNEYNKESKKNNSTNNKNNVDIKLSFSTKVKSVLSKSITLNDKDIDNFLENIEMLLLKSDVSYDTTNDFIEEMHTNLKATKFNAKNMQNELMDIIKQSLYNILKRNEFNIDLINFVKDKISKNEVPVKILFLGPNGTGKTTTIAKIAYMLKKNGLSSCMSASDTFRAAAIEQTVYHASKVGVPVIKNNYGSDPASVAFDAIAYAKSHNIQTVLIDSAGRQDTNKNLINEMQKIVRVSKPDLIIFVGESTAGGALINQIIEFNKFIKIDGIILTKLDCDAKGGNAISIAHEVGIPVLFLGIGEAYDAIVKYSPEFIVNSVVGAS